MSPSETPDINHKSEKPSIQKDHQALLLFLLSLAVYLLTRLIRLPDFPIYFFSDEAIQTQHAADLISNCFRDLEGVFLPTYFENGGQYNLSLSVYAQVLPTLLFGKSIWVTRGVSVVISLIAAVALGLTLKTIFKVRFWWLGTLLLAVTPAWFLHSRTAFETVMMTSLYAGFIYFYLQYRTRKPGYLYLSLVFGACAFYAYSPGQVIMVITGLLLVIADAHYHWEHRKTVLIGLGLLVLLAVPYLRFMLTGGEATLQHLALLNSYWVKPIPLLEKVGMYLLRYLKGFNPLYWFCPNPILLEKIWPQIQLPTWLFSNQLDLSRHIMKGYGHILPITFPFWITGLARCVRRFKDPAHRTLLLASLAAPSGAAIVDWGITRGMVFIIPTLLIITLGWDSAYQWLGNKYSNLTYAPITLGLFLILTAYSFWMLGDALKNGPTWYDDYGLGGMQYGARQVFERAEAIALKEPETTVLVSSTWANASDVLMRYFTDDLPNVRMGNINAFGYQYQSLDRRYLFVMTEEDLNYVKESGKFMNVTIEETLPYPDGRVGFYFVRLEYVPDIESILAKERAERQALRTENLTLLGQLVRVEYPALDMNEIKHVFDGDPASVVRTLEANPLRLVLTFEEPVQINAITLIVGGTPTRVTASSYYQEKVLESKAQQVEQAAVKREILLTFSSPTLADQLEIEVLNTHDGEIAHVHLWEVIIK